MGFVGHLTSRGFNSSICDLRTSLAATLCVAHIQFEGTSRNVNHVFCREPEVGKENVIGEEGIIEPQACYRCVLVFLLYFLFFPFFTF